MANTTPGYIDEKTIVPLQADIATPDYKVNYGDERFTQVEQEKDAALGKLTETYDGIIGESDKYYQAQIDASKQWAEQQQKLQQEQSDFAIEQIEQQKDQANKDYIKEQSGAYTDWQKQSNQYGVNAEKQASAGLAGTGYSESAQVSMYNTYQNRVASARESYTRAVLNYDNAIKEAMLQNNTILAEIAYKAQQEQLELALAGFQYKNTLVLEKANKEIELDNMYYQRYQDVLAQINQENATAEQIRQYNQTLQLEIDKYNQTYEQGIREYNEQIRQFEAEYARAKAKDDADAKAEAARLEEQIEERKQQQKQWEAEMELKKQQLEMQEAQIEAASSSSGSSGGGTAPISSGSGGSSAKVYGNNNSEVTTDYYSGRIPMDTKLAIDQYGTFNNGYQPKGIKSYGKVSKAGWTISVNTTTLSGQKRTIQQNVWKTSDGTLWYWEGREMKYKKLNISRESVAASGGGGGSGIKPISKAIK